MEVHNPAEILVETQSDRIESATIYAEKILPIWIDSRGISWETTGRLSRQRSSSEAWLSRFSDF